MGGGWVKNKSKKGSSKNIDTVSYALKMGVSIECYVIITPGVYMS